MTCPISGTLMQIRFLVCNQWRCESIDHRPNSMRNQKLNVSALWDPRTSEHEIFTVQRNIHNKIIKSTYTIFLGADFPYFSLKSSDCKLVVSSRISSLDNVYIYIYMYKKHQPCKLCCPGLCEFCNLACPGLFWTLPRFNWTLLNTLLWRRHYTYTLLWRRYYRKSRNSTANSCCSKHLHPFNLRSCVHFSIP